VFLFIDLCVDNFPYCHAHIVVAYEVTSIIVQFMTCLETHAMGTKVGTDANSLSIM
jgi:hypothetical protein